MSTELDQEVAECLDCLEQDQLVDEPLIAEIVHSLVNSPFRTGPLIRIVRIVRKIAESIQVNPDLAITYRYGGWDTRIDDLEQPAVLCIKATANPVQESGSSWREGEIVEVFPQDHVFSFREMPVKAMGAFTVDQINGSPQEPTLYEGFKLLDSGTVTKGDTPVEVQEGDVIVMTYPNTFRNYGDQTVVPDLIYHARVSDRTVSETQQYRERFNKKVTQESLQYNPETHMRRVEVTNLRVSATGGNGFTDAGTQAIADEWNGERVSWSPEEFTIDAVLPPEDFERFQDSVYELAFDDEYRKRRWGFTPEGMAALRANDGHLSGTAAQIGPYLRDGMLD